MIAYLIGRLQAVGTDSLVIEVGHIGYNVKIPSSVADRLPGIGEEVKLYTYTSVREDAISLYGFLSRDDLEMFRLLIGVNGIGPKGGQAVLSVLSADELRMAILAGDAKAIARAPGIGARTAQRVILDLKDRVSLEDLTRAPSSDGQAIPAASSDVSSQAVEALVALGYGASEALRAVRQAGDDGTYTVEELLKAALKHLI